MGSQLDTSTVYVDGDVRAVISGASPPIDHQLAVMATSPN